MAADLIYSLLIWTGGAIALAPCVDPVVHWLEDWWQRLADTRIVLRIEHKNVSRLRSVGLCRRQDPREVRSGR